jgi:hypothetical protein
VRRYVSSNVVGACGGQALPIRRCFTPRTTTISASTLTPRATTSTTAPPTTAPAAASCWNWRAPLRNRRCGRRTPSTLPAVTAEEQGLLGSQYLGMHPPVPAGKIALDLNYDMLLPIGIPRSVSLGGAERIDFWPTVETVAKAFDLALLPDPTPGAGHYYRSDHFSLARVGIPGVFRRPGRAVRRPRRGLGPRAVREDYVQHHYHQPSDEYRADWDFRGNAKLARFGLVLGWLASEQQKPCFSMALGAQLGGAGLTPSKIETHAAVTLAKVGDGFSITKIALTTTASVPGATKDVFDTAAAGAKAGCPISKLFANNTEITLDAKLV